MKQNIIFSAILILSASLFGDVRLPDVLSDRMLLQRGVEVPIWGIADPGEKITVQFAGQTRTTTAGKDGRFQVKLAPMEASNVNREMVVSGKNTIRIREVLVGDVWLCSGQSNMDFCVDAGLNKEKERLAAKYPEIRLFYVRRAHAFKPAFHTKSTWKYCENWHAAVFSAVGYFFGRELYRALGIPIGLIDASYGGTPIEPWFSREKYEATPAIREKLKLVQGGDKGNRGAALGYADPEFDDSSWKTITLPKAKNAVPLMKTEGEFWLRKQIDIPADWKGNLDLIELGLIFGIDTVYLNGKPIASTGYDAPFWWERLHTYRELPKGIAPQGKTVLALRIFGKDMYGWKQMVLQRYDDRIPRNRIDLSGTWKFKPVYTLPPEEADHLRYTAQPTVLYNGMIAPLQPYPIKGAIWYQGESNASRAKEYPLLFRCMVEDWREKWNCGDFPVYFVQLPGYIHESWEEFRIVQSKLPDLVPNTDMIVTIDIGDPKEIHPPWKLPFGVRLANLALAKTYGKPIPFKGPVFRRAERIGKNVTLHFETAAGLKSRTAGKLRGFEAAGPDGKFHPAKAEIRGNRVILTADTAPVLKVRYAWGRVPECDLADNNNLPAGPFLCSLNEKQNR